MTNNIYTVYEITRTDEKKYIGCTKRWNRISGKHNRLEEHKNGHKFEIGIKEYRVIFQTRLKLLADMMETYWCKKLEPELNRH